LRNHIFGISYCFPPSTKKIAYMKLSVIEKVDVSARQAEQGFEVIRFFFFSSDARLVRTLSTIVHRLRGPAGKTCFSKVFMVHRHFVSIYEEKGLKTLPAPTGARSGNLSTGRRTDADGATSC
ncbi:MAG: hypothetical protein KH208_02035, partial [Desulfovibrio sp.]|uniref:hypothetical protein n=1 Tax=Desulfovibrio sp. TaxID=885 RepID=UPI0025BEE04D